MTTAQQHSHQASQSVLSAQQEADAKQWLCSQFADQSIRINGATGVQVHQLMDTYFPQGVQGFLASYADASTIDLGLLDYHHNIHPLGYFVDTHHTQSLMQLCGGYLEKMPLQQRVCSIYVGSYFMIQPKLQDMLVDSRITGIIPADIGKIFMQMDPTEWFGLISCITANTKAECLSK